jgi:hypothetical protein
MTTPSAPEATSHAEANAEWEATHGTVTSLLAALTRIENHITAGRADAALATIGRARVTADRNRTRDEKARLEKAAAH